MFWNKRNRKRSAQANAAINWVIIAMVGLAVVTHFTNKKGELSVTMPDAATDMANKTVVNLKHYRNKILPDQPAILTVQEEKEGEGAPAICGQVVTLAFEAFDKEGQPINDSASQDTPITFTIGEKKAMPAFEQGLLGMRTGGIRNIFAPPSFAYGVPGFDRENMPIKENVTFKVHLLAITPPLPAPDETPYRFIENKYGTGHMLTCGDSASFNMIIWALDGKKLFATAKPITITPGSSSHFLGVEIAALNMKPGGARTIITPPFFQKRLNGKPDALEIPFPKDQTVLVDIQWVQ